jgi:hypothetical protein
MRNVTVCKYNCPCFRVHFPKESAGQALYQCTRDIDTDGFSQGPYPFDLVQTMPMPKSCERALHQAVLGDGSVLDMADVTLHCGITAANVGRFLTLCTNCRFFRHELAPAAGEQIMFCDKDVGPDGAFPESEMQHEQLAYTYGCAPAYLTRPAPEGCPLGAEQKALKDTFAPKA